MAYGNLAIIKHGHPQKLASPFVFLVGLLLFPLDLVLYVLNALIWPIMACCRVYDWEPFNAALGIYVVRTAQDLWDSDQRPLSLQAVYEPNVTQELIVNFLNRRED